MTHITPEQFMRERIVYKKFMTFQQLINTKSERLCKKVKKNGI